jgi:hypothetical protein
VQWKGVIGVGVPAVVRRGVVYTAANSELAMTLFLQLTRHIFCAVYGHIKAGSRSCTMVSELRVFEDAVQPEVLACTVSSEHVTSSR